MRKLHTSTRCYGNVKDGYCSRCKKLVDNVETSDTVMFSKIITITKTGEFVTNKVIQNKIIDTLKGYRKV